MVKLAGKSPSKINWSAKRLYAWAQKSSRLIWIGRLATTRTSVSVLMTCFNIFLTCICGP